MEPPSESHDRNSGHVIMYATMYVSIHLYIYIYIYVCTRAVNSEIASVMSTEPGMEYGLWSNLPRYTRPSGAI